MEDANRFVSIHLVLDSPFDHFFLGKRTGTDWMDAYLQP